jgi:hypothetical protein
LWALFFNSTKSWHEELCHFCSFFVLLKVYNFFLQCWNDLEELILNCKPNEWNLRKNGVISLQSYKPWNYSAFVSIYPIECKTFRFQMIPLLYYIRLCKNHLSKSIESAKYLKWNTFQFIRVQEKWHIDIHVWTL